MIHHALVTIVELGSIYAIAALGVLLSASILEFYDLTVDGTFTLGAAITAACLTAGLPIGVAMALAIPAGVIAGVVTASVARTGVQPLLAGILVMFSLYSLNLHIMRASNVSLGRFQMAYSATRLPAAVLLAITSVVVGIFAHWLLCTRVGAILRTAAKSPNFVQSMGYAPHVPVVVALSISNGLVAFAGSLMAQLQEYADVGMGDGTLIYSLAAIIIGHAAVGEKRRGPTALVVGAVVGALVYQGLIAGALRVGIAPTDLRLITAVLVLTFLIIRSVGRRRRERS